MQRFQQILQRAITEHATCVTLSGNSSPIGSLPQGDFDWVDFGNTEPNYIGNLFKVLFPAGVLDKPERGQIDVPNYGKLLTIAVPGPIPRLLVFMPSGHPQFQPTWDEIVNSMNAEPLETIMPDNPFEATMTHAAHEVRQAQNPSNMNGGLNAPLPPPPVPGHFVENMHQQPVPNPSPQEIHPVAVNTSSTPAYSPISQVQPPAVDQTGLPLQNQASQNGYSPELDVQAPYAQDATPPELFSSSSNSGFNPEINEVSVGMAPSGNAAPPSLDEPLPANMFADVSTPSTLSPPTEENQMGLYQPSVAGNPLTPENHEADLNLYHASNGGTASGVPASQLAIQNHSQMQPSSTPDAMKAPGPQPGRKLNTTIEPGPKEIDELLRFMLEKGASDLHITTGQPIALRIDGEVARFNMWDIDEAMFFRLFNPITSELNQHEYFESNDTDFAYEIPGIARFRVNLFRDRLGPCAVLRQIPSKILSFEDLRLPEQLRKLCYLNKGLVVVTGPTGSGKSTTLAALVDHMNDVRRDHILTLEDPIEFVHPQKNCLIRQREIRKHTDSFARALKAALREDPDIILVGELRDLETTALAIEIAETGHLVMGTLHTTTAVSTIDRVIDQFPSDQQEQIRTMLSESLKGVVAQTLMRKIGGGRCAAHEILMVDSAVSALIREGKTHMIPNQMQSQKAAGNVLLNDSLTKCVIQGLVEPKEAWMKSVQKSELLNRFRAAGVDMRWYDQFNEEKKDQKAS